MADRRAELHQGESKAGSRKTVGAEPRSVARSMHPREGLEERKSNERTSARHLQHSAHARGDMHASNLPKTPGAKQKEIYKRDQHPTKKACISMDNYQVTSTAETEMDRGIRNELSRKKLA